MATKNATILDRVWLNGTTDYQQRIPRATQQSVASTAKALTDPMNGQYYNQFISQFINLIGAQYVHQQRWENPLEVFKGATLQYGTTVQEVIPHWLKAHAYKDNITDLLKMERPDADIFYHTMNRQDRYDVTINRLEFEQAFKDEYGLNRCIAQITQNAINSDKWDEFNLMMNQIAVYEENLKFYKHKLSSYPKDEATGKEFLTALRAYADKLQFPNRIYTPEIVDAPVFAKPEELVLIIEADANASVDVNTLSAVFQLDKAQVKYRTIVVPEIPIDGAFALLTTDAFFVVRDKIRTMESFYDPKTLNEHFFYHHWELVSTSPVVPCILFGTNDGTEIPTITQTVTGIEAKLDNDVTTVYPGGQYQMLTKLVGTLSPENDNLTVAPSSVIANITAKRGEESVQLNSRTYVDKYNVLHIQKTGLKSGDIITVEVTSTYNNPDATAQKKFNATIELTVH